MFLLVFLVLVCTGGSRANGSLSFRPPSTPFLTFGPMQQKYLTIGEDTLLSGETTYWNPFEKMPVFVGVRINRQGPLRTLLGSYQSTYPASLSVVNRSTTARRNPDRTETCMGPDDFVVSQTSMPSVSALITALTFSVFSCTNSEIPIGTIVLETIHTFMPRNLVLASRPLVYLNVSFVRVAGSTPTFPIWSVAFYIDASSENSIHLDTSYSSTNSTLNPWVTASLGKRVNSSHIKSVKLGAAAPQSILQSHGDDFMLNWGHLYLSGDSGRDASEPMISGGLTHTAMRDSFAATGALPQTMIAENDTITTPAFVVNSSTSVLPESVVIALAQELTVPSGNSSGTSGASLLWTFSYDEIHLLSYFGQPIQGRWAANGTMANLVELAFHEADRTISECRELDRQLWNQTEEKFGKKYAQIAALAFRQTFAATQFAAPSAQYDHEEWAFLKEISTDGDINTMDVIFPASPLFLYTNPEIVKQLLLPVLHFANNDTNHPFSDPFSPHQLGVWPIANSTTQRQEVMPMENTGNMFLLLLAYVQHTNEENATGWFFPKYWSVLTQWADYLMATQLPDPPFQICTDDFAGPLNHSVNLAVKGIIALHAFGELCTLVSSRSQEECQPYILKAKAFGQYWVDHSVDTDLVSGLNFTKLAYDQPSTWSTKYNLVWQSLLASRSSTGLTGWPIPNFETIAKNEVVWYSVRSNQYGFPMDSSHSYQKLDWMTWGASLAAPDTAHFVTLFEGIFHMANETIARVPLSDLFDTHSAGAVLPGFVARPVVGAVFLPLLLPFNVTKTSR